MALEAAKQKKFCPNCHILVSQDCCPVCYRTQLYTPEPDDFCLLTELEMVWAGVFAECLCDNEIPFTEENAVGAWLSARMGVSFERRRFFVPYGRFEQAKLLLEELFAGETVDEID